MHLTQKTHSMYARLAAFKRKSCALNLTSKKLQEVKQSTKMIVNGKCILKIILPLTILSSVCTQSTTTPPPDTKPDEEAAKAAGNGSVAEDVVSVEWSYDNETGPAVWPKLGYPQCGGKLQSPINIDSEDISKYEYNDLLIFQHYDDVASKVTVENNGHTLQARFEYPPGAPRPTVSGGQLGGTFQFEQLHFHWGYHGGKAYRGSEHTVDGVRFPLEMHMVHRNVKYKTMAQAVNNTDGILVLASLFEMNTNNIMELLKGVELVIDMVAPLHGSASLKPRPLASVLPDDTTGFYRYRGSLTTPGCQQSVQWVVFEKHAHVIISQMKMLRRLSKDPDETVHILNNYRPIQSLNGRKVYHMIYKNPGQVATESSAPGMPRPVLVAYGILAAITLLCNAIL